MDQHPIYTDNILKALEVSILANVPCTLTARQCGVIVHFVNKARAVMVPDYHEECWAIAHVSGGSLYFFTGTPLDGAWVSSPSKMRKYNFKKDAEQTLRRANSMDYPFIDRAYLVKVSINVTVSEPD